MAVEKGYIKIDKDGREKKTKCKECRIRTKCLSEVKIAVVQFANTTLN